MVYLGETTNEAPDIIVATVLAEPGTLMMVWDEDLKEIDFYPVVVWVTLEDGDTLAAAYTKEGYADTHVDHFGMHWSNGTVAFNTGATDEQMQEYRRLTLIGEHRYRMEKRQSRE